MTIPLSEIALPTDRPVAVAVTGASGYVGSHLVDQLLRKGHEVRACVRDTGNSRKTRFLHERKECGTGQLKLFSADMTKAGAYDAVFEGAHTVFHPAEVFMSFGTGRDTKQAAADFGKRPKLQDLNKNALLSTQYVIDSVNKSSTVRRLVYTSSVAAMMPGLWEGNYTVSEAREPHPSFWGPATYAMTKRATELLLASSALQSGRWSLVVANPSDIVGPILSPHQATETWQGKLATVLGGSPAPQEDGGRPHMWVDVRDVAAAEIALAETATVRSGQRFLLCSGDRVLPETIGPRIMELYPGFDLPSHALGPRGKVARNAPIWNRVSTDNSRVRSTIGLAFRDYDDTLKSTIDSLIQIGGVKPRAKL